MKIIRINAVAMFLLMSLVYPAWAELPLTIEDLLTEQGKITLTTSFAYANSNQKGVATGQPIIVQTGPTSFITIPTSVGDVHTNTERKRRSTGADNAYQPVLATCIPISTAVWLRWDCAMA